MNLKQKVRNNKHQLRSESLERETIFNNNKPKKKNKNKKNNIETLFVKRGNKLAMQLGTYGESSLPVN